MYKVHVIGDRPDFRVFLDLLYGRIHNVDTEGNADPVNSRNWTDLYIQDRESSDPPIDVIVSSEKSNLFEVDSEASKLEEIVSIYLFESCGCSIFHENKKLSPQEIKNMKIKYSTELNRARLSIWHHSSDNNPYPNQSII